jgi:hypothetical protein
MKRKSFISSILVTVTLLGACMPQGSSKLENQIPTIRTQTTIAAGTVQAENLVSSPPVDCPATVPQDPAFVPPSPYDQLDFDGEFWYGSGSLWTSLRLDGTWSDLPHDSSGYTQKVFWWREGYEKEEEPEPALAVTAERIDAKAPRGESSQATNASSSAIGTAMLIGLNLPTPGCWKVTGQYGNAELSFVVRVVP